MKQLDLFSYQQEFNAPVCKRCGSSHIKKDGKYKRASKQVHRYKCARCSCRFVLITSDLEKMRHHSSVVAFASQLYAEAGIGYRSVARLLKQYFDVKASHQAVSDWLAKTAKTVYIPNVSNINIESWAVDETQLKVNGKHIWLWVVFDPVHKLVLSWHVSKTRYLNDAITVLKNALQATGCRPQKIITDAWHGYYRAIKKVIGYRFTHHYIVGLGHNNYIERFFREIKRRTKWFSTFRATHSLQDFIATFIYCYHYHKPHKTLGWQTPASLT